MAKYDYLFSENGLVAHKNGQLIFQENIIKYIGEEKLQKFLNFCMGYMSKIELPFKRFVLSFNRLAVVLGIL